MCTSWTNTHRCLVMSKHLRHHPTVQHTMTTLEFLLLTAKWFALFIFVILLNKGNWSGIFLALDLVFYNVVVFALVVEVSLLGFFFVCVFGRSCSFLVWLELPTGSVDWLELPVMCWVWPKTLLAQLLLLNDVSCGLQWCGELANGCCVCQIEMNVLQRFCLVIDCGLLISFINDE